LANFRTNKGYGREDVMITCDYCPYFMILNEPIWEDPFGYCVMYCSKYNAYFPNGYAMENWAKANKCPKLRLIQGGLAQ